MFLLVYLGVLMWILGMKDIRKGCIVENSLVIELVIVISVLFFDNVNLIDYN